MKKLKTPSCVQCLCCHVILLSQSQHDYQQCACSNETFVDGGYDYLIYGGRDLSYVRALRLVTFKDVKRKGK